MATTLLIISAIFFLITNGIEIFLYNAQNDKHSFFHRESWMMWWNNYNGFYEKGCPLISDISLFILMPTSISIAFHLNWFLAFGSALLLKFIVQRTLVNIYISIFRRANLYSSMIKTFIIGIITMIIGILIW